MQARVLVTQLSGYPDSCLQQIALKLATLPNADLLHGAISSKDDHVKTNQ